MKKIFALAAMALMAIASPAIAQPNGAAKKEKDSPVSGSTVAAGVIGALFVGGGAGALWSNSNSEGYHAPHVDTPPSLETFILEGHSHQ